VTVAPPDAELFGIEKVGRIDLVIDEHVRRRPISFFETRSRLVSGAFAPVFVFSPVARLTYHNVLYDTPMGDPVNLTVLA
jgi:hypothetical protein